MTPKAASRKDGTAGRGPATHLSAGERDTLTASLRARFEEYAARHPDIAWAQVEERLQANPAKLWSLHRMETTGGEPDVIGRDPKTKELLFVDCARESPAGRRSLCFDQAALAARKEAKPRDSAVRMAQEMGIELLTEEQYRGLQELGEFDTKTSSWIQTPASIRSLGGAVFCDRRYNHVFLYHNGAESYYAARGFRGMLKV